MSSEVPLDLSNESKPEKTLNTTKLTLNSNINSINGTKNVTKSKRKLTQNVKQFFTKSDEELHKKHKSLNVSTSSASDVNPLQRGKYGLRMLPTQVDYYQSILEDRRIRMYKESSRPTPAAERLEVIQKPETKPKRKMKANETVGKYEFEIGDIVWATLPNYKTWFPALIISHLHCKQKAAKKGQTWVYWFGDHQVSEIPKSKIKSFVANFLEFSKGTSAPNSLRVKEALQVLAARAGITFPLDSNVATSSTCADDEESALICWAKNGFQLKIGLTHESAFKADPLNPIPSSAASYLPLDSVYSEALKTDERLQQIVYYEVDKTDTTESSHELPEYKVSQIERVKRKEVSINQICIACCCDAEALVGNQSKDLLQHPIFEGGLCRLCYDNIRVTMYAPGADFKNSFCAICGQLGNLAICENQFCHRVYCLKCIDLLVGSGVHLKVLEVEKWECFICKPSVEETGLLKVRPNWRFNVKVMFDPLIGALKSSSNLSEDMSNDKKQLRVLSLSDGISSAKLSLEKLGLKIDAYFASESDTDGIEISKRYHENSILYVESIENISIEKILSMSPIDLVLGSSAPDYSSVNSGRKSLIETKNSHFFVYFNQILHLIRLTNKCRHVFFLCENSNPLNNSQKDIISNLFMCKPITLYANEFPQNRNRYYWSNIPGIKRPLPQTIQEKFISLINISTQIMCRKPGSDKLQSNPKSEDKSFEPKELEKLFELEANYTDVMSIAMNKRQSLLTRCWSQSILCHLIWSLTDFFITTERQLK